MQIHIKSFASLLVASGLAVGMAMTAGCSSDSKADAAPVPNPVPEEAQFYSLHSGTRLSALVKAQKQLRVLATQQEYATALMEYTNDIPKVVDFTKGVVVLLDRGWAPSPGHGISMVTVDVASNYVIANVELTNPTCAQSAVLANPYQFVYVPTTKTILFSEKMVSYTCP